MSENDTPLQKQLINLSLNAGVNEQARVEAVDGPHDAITTLENLVQDADGSWVKREGLVLLGGTYNDDTGTRIDTPRKVLRTKKGLGLIASDYDPYFYHYQENLQQFRKLQPASDYAVVGSVVSAGPPDSYGRPLDVAGSSKFDCIAYEGDTRADTTTDYVLVISERASETVVKYTLTDVAPGGSFTAGGGQVKICMVDDRYLHIYAHDGPAGGTDCNLAVMDLNSALPTDLTGLTTMAVNLSTNENLEDATGYSGGSVAVFSSTHSYFTAHNNSRTLQSEHTENNTVYDQVDVDANGDIFFMGTDSGTGRNVVYQALPTSLGTSITNWIDGSLAVAGEGMAVYDDGRVAFVDASGNYYEMATAGATAFTLRGTFRADAFHQVARPFRNRINDKIYLHVAGLDSDADVSHHALICLSDYRTDRDNGTTKIYGFRVAATLDPFNGVKTVGGGNEKMPRYESYDNNTKTAVALAYLSAARINSYGVLQLRHLDPLSWASHSLGNTDYLSGGAIHEWDGQRVHEAGIVDRPVVTAAAGAAGNPSGTYNYVAVHRMVNASGDVSWSRTSPVISVTVASKKVDVTITPVNVTSRETGEDGDERIHTELYRTESGGTQYHLVATTAGGSFQALTINTGGLLVVSDDYADATMAAFPLLHRQPGTNGTAKDRYPPPPSTVLISHKDRLFCTDAYGQRVYYSSFFVDGEAAWFNPAFQITPHGGTGPITGMASIDGRLVVFKRDAVFVISGDGPPEAGGGGFATPHRVAARFGCINHRSIVQVDDGIVYQSERGFEKLSRSLAITHVGQRVQDTLASFPYCTGSTIDNRGRVRWTMNTGEGVIATGASKEIVMDVLSGKPVWSTSKLWMSGVYGGACGGVVTVRLLDSGTPKDFSIYIAPADGVYYASDSTNLDNSSYVPITIETAWVHISGPNGRQRVEHAYLLGSLAANHRLVMSLDYDYAGSYADTKTFGDAAVNDSSEYIFMRNAANPQTLATRLKVEDLAPADTGSYPVTTGAGPEILGITLEVAPKRGGYKLPSDQKA